MKMNRRSFIKNSSAMFAATSAGVLGYHDSASALSDKPPIRLVTIMNALGIMPQVRNDHYVTTPEGIEPLATSDFKTAIAPLQDFREHMIVMQGLDNASAITQGRGSHAGGASHIFTGGNVRSGTSGTLVTTTGPSLDVHIASLISGRAGTPYRHLNLNAATLGGEGQMNFSHDQNGVQVPRLVGPQKIYEQIFSRSMDDGPTDSFSLQAKIAVLNNVGEHIARLKSDLPGMTGQDTLSFYQSSMDQLAQQFRNQADFTTSASCMVPGVPDLGFNTHGLTPEEVNFETKKAMDREINATMDLAFQVLNCNYTRVLTMDFGGVQPKHNYPWLGEELERYGAPASMANSESHGISHQGSTGAFIYQCVVRNYYAQKYAQFFQRMADTPDIDGTSSMLDNTIFLWLTEVSRGPDHGMRDYPITLLVGKNTGFRQGGLNCKFDGRPMNDLYTTILKAIDLPHSSFGEPTVNTGTIDELLA